MCTRQKGVLGNRPIIITFAVMVGMAAALWFGGFLAPESVSADGHRSSFECAYAPQEECEGVALTLRPNVQPASGSTASVSESQPEIALLSSNGGATAAPSSAGWECWFVGGWHCFWVSSPAAAIQNTETAEYASHLSTAAYLELGSTQGFDADAGFGGEELMPTSCLLPGIPCTLDDSQGVIERIIIEGGSLELPTY